MINDKMISKVAALSAQLREQGMPVSIRSTQDAVKIHQDLGEEDRELLKTALMAIYVKDRYDIPKISEDFRQGIFRKEKGKDG